MKDIPEWKKFEIAVASFLKSLGGNAKVTHDATIPDEDTGSPRQRDVWIECSVLGLFPVKIYVSCKFLNKALDEQDIDAVIGELLSSGAEQGAVYSKSGFNKLALKKAKKHGIFCCSLYQNQPPEIPNIIILKHYCCKSRFFLKCHRKPDQLEIWGELFRLKTDSGTVLDEIVKTFERLEEELLQEKKRAGRLFPKDGFLMCSVEDVDHQKIEVQASLIWKVYEATLSGYMVDGSYDFSQQKFTGTQTGPIISLNTEDPGNGWVLLKERPSNNKNTCVAVPSKPDFRNSIEKSLSSQKIDFPITRKMY